MNNDKNTKNSCFRMFYFDFIVATFSMLVFMLVWTIGSIIVTGSREEGMSYGLIIGLASGFKAFYYVRGQFNFIWTFLQLIINSGLTVVEFFGVYYLLKNTGISEISYGYLLIFISLPALASINKQTLDYFAKKLNAESRIKQPMKNL